VNSKERLKRQGGEMSGRRTSTFDEAITFPLVVLAFGGAISSLITEPDRCVRCGHEPLTHNGQSGVCWEDNPRDDTGTLICGCPAYVPPKGEP
jgi:hypothetical protein